MQRVELKKQGTHFFPLHDNVIRAHETVEIWDGFPYHVQRKRCPKTTDTSHACQIRLR